MQTVGLAAEAWSPYTPLEIVAGNDPALADALWNDFLDDTGSFFDFFKDGFKLDFQAWQEQIDGETTDVVQDFFDLLEWEMEVLETFKGMALDTVKEIMPEVDFGDFYDAWTDFQSFMDDLNGNNGDKDGADWFDKGAGGGGEGGVGGGAGGTGGQEGFDGTPNFQ